MAADSRKKPWWESDIAPGIALCAATFVSFGFQNSALRDEFITLIKAPIDIALLGFQAHTDLAHAVADGLMAIFFLFVGLELKRECIEGPFRNPRDAALPLCGALGGMAAPALIYLAVVLPSEPSLARGWAIPAATDIAFAIGVMSLLGKRAPAGLRLFLLALAIIDDLGAILIIAFFYSQSIAGWALGGAAATFTLMMALNRYGVTRLWPFWALGLVLWGFVAASGVHATLAGVLTALAVPMRRPDGHSPLVTAEHALKPWVQLGIMPVFALVNAGAPLTGVEALTHPLALAIIAGLVIGKPIGVMGGTLLAARLMNHAPPARFLPMLGMAMLAGVGFTMSLFIGNLAFTDDALAAPLRLGVLCGSALSGLVGFALLYRAAHSHEGEDPELREMETLARREGVFDDGDD